MAASLVSLIAPLKRMMEPPVIRLSTYYGTPNQPGRPGPVVGMVVERSLAAPRSRQKRKPKAKAAEGGKKMSLFSSGTQHADVNTKLAPELEGIFVVTPRALERYYLSGMPTKRVALSDAITAFCNTAIAGVGRVFICATQRGEVHILRAALLDTMSTLSTTASPDSPQGPVRLLTGEVSALSSRTTSFANNTWASVSDECSQSSAEQTASYLPFCTESTTIGGNTEGAVTEESSSATSDPTAERGACTIGDEIYTLAVQCSFADFAQTMMAGTAKGEVFVWEVPSGRLRHVLPCPAETNEPQPRPAGAVVSSSAAPLITRIVGNGQAPRMGKGLLFEADGNVELNGSNSLASDTPPFHREPSTPDSKATDSRGAPTATSPRPEARAGDWAQETDSPPPGPDAPEGFAEPRKRYVSSMLVVTEPNGSSNLWVGYGTGHLGIFDLKSGEQLRLLRMPEEGAVNALEWSSQLGLVVALSDNTHVSVWSTGRLSLVKVFLATFLTNGLPLSFLKMADCDRASANGSSAVLFLGCVEGSICVRRIFWAPCDADNSPEERTPSYKGEPDDRAAAELQCVLLRHFVKEVEPRCPITSIWIDVKLDAMFVGDASGVVSTFLPIRYLLESWSSQDIPPLTYRCLTTHNFNNVKQGSMTSRRSSALPLSARSGGLTPPPPIAPPPELASFPETQRPPAPWK